MQASKMRLWAVLAALCCGFWSSAQAQPVKIVATTSFLADMAQALHLSERTLKRRLQDEGVSYRVLLAEVRGRQANRLLEDETLSLTEIAERMGFSDLSSFSQAYKRWFGVAPSVGRAGTQTRGA